MKKPTRLSREFEWRKFQGTGEPGSPDALLRRVSFLGSLRFFFRALLEKATRYQQRRLDEELW